MTSRLPTLIRVRTSAADDGSDAAAGGRAAVAANEPASVGDRLRKLLVSNGESEPLYPRVLRLRHVHPNGWQRAVLVEGVAILGALAALADKATSWAPVILPVAAAAVVKFHDVLVGLLPRRPRR